MSAPDPKRIVRRLIDEVMNGGDLAVLDELYAPQLAPVARRWVTPFLASFSDVEMRIVDLVAEGGTVVGRFTCSGTHTGTWLHHPPTGRRFTNVAEVYFFRVADGCIVRAWGLEATLDRLRQLGLDADSSSPNTLSDDRNGRSLSSG
jgi:predicted ester cyclase